MVRPTPLRVYHHNMQKAGRNAGFAALIVTAFWSAGCGDLVSLHALHTRQNQVFDVAVEGRWENDDNTLEVRRDDDAYKIMLQGRRTSEPPTEFEMHLVDVSGVRFADLLPADHLGHMILRVRVAEGQLHVDFFDSKWLRERVPHDEADIENFRKQSVLTQPPSQLRSLVAKYVREPKAFGDEVVFRKAR
jgi:hypothetical protein